MNIKKRFGNFVSLLPLKRCPDRLCRTPNEDGELFHIRTIVMRFLTFLYVNKFVRCVGRWTDVPMRTYFEAVSVCLRRYRTPNNLLVWLSHSSELPWLKSKPHHLFLQAFLKSSSLTHRLFPVQSRGLLSAAYGDLFYINPTKSWYMHREAVDRWARKRYQA